MDRIRIDNEELLVKCDLDHDAMIKELIDKKIAVGVCPSCGLKLHSSITQVIDNDTNPKQPDFTGVERDFVERQLNVVLLTPKECGVIYRNLQNTWLNRDDNFDLARKILQRLYRCSHGLVS
jgi:hypothetical protein